MCDIPVRARRRESVHSTPSGTPTMHLIQAESMAKKPAAPRTAPYLSRTKVTPPIASPFEVQRRAILDRLITDRNRVVLMHAPAGFGKTTVMTQLFSHYRDQGVATAWLTLDSGDDDVSRFLSAFASAVASLPNTGTTRPEQPQRNADLTRWILDRIADVNGPVVLFFDDFEALHNPVIIASIASGIETMAPQARIVIGSRTMPDIGLARLRARGALTEVDVASLRFSTQEADDFLTHRRGVALAAEQVQRLHRSTEGWVAALWLASLVLERRSDTDKFIAEFSGSNTAIANYLAEDVLAALPDTLRDFMLRCAVLDELDVDLCNAVTGRDDSLDLLHALERHHLFLMPLDEHGTSYRFHGLFRDFLLNRLQRQHRQELPSLHQAASQAYLDAGRPIPAIRHALRTQDSAATVALLETHVDELLGQGRLRLLTDWLAQLPVDALSRHPRLRMIYAWSLAFTRGPAEALKLVNDLDYRTLPDEPAAHLLALRPMLLAMMDRIEEAHRLGTEALTQIPENHAFARTMLCQALTQTSIILGLHEDARRYVDEARRAQTDVRSSFALVLAEAAEALLDLMGGRLKQAVTRMKLATSFSGQERQRERNGNALAAIQMAEALYESDDCVAAQRLLEINAPLLQDLGLPDALICAHVLLSRIVDSQGDGDRALQLLTELEAHGHRLGIARVSASARLERARLRLIRGDASGCAEQLTAAEQIYPWSETGTRWFVANDTLTPVIGRIRWMIRTGAAAKALPLIRDELATAEQQQRGRRALKLRILLAEALQADSQPKMALRTLSRARQIARAEGFVRTFIEESPTIPALLAQLDQEQSEDGMEEAATAPVEPLAASSAAANALADPLTAKELQVLSLLAQGYSNIAMAERLFVSESTVRTHLRSINLKLHAGNRTQAIAIARRLGLIT